MEDLPIQSDALMLSVSGGIPRTSDRTMIECGLKEKNVLDYAAFNSQTDGSIQDRFCEFIVPRSPSLIDLNDICLGIKGKITKSDGSVLTDVDNVILSNNFLHSCLKSLSLYLNGVLVESQTNYAHNAMIKQLTKFKELDLERKGRCIGLFDPQNFNTTTFTDGFFGGLSEDMKHNMTSIKENGFDMYGPLLLDIGNTSSYLAPSVEIRIRLDLHDPSFALCSTKEESLKIHINSMKLFVSHYTMRTNASLALETSILKAPLTYPYRKWISKPILLNSNSTLLSIESPFNGNIPSKIHIAFMDLASYSGKHYKLNKMFYGSHRLSNIKISVNNGMVYNVRSEFPNSISHLYHTVLTSLGNGDINLMKLGTFLNGSTILAFNMDPEILEDGIHPIKSGANLRLDLEFEQNDKNLVVLLIGEFNSSFSINGSRQVVHSSVV